jgi:hypothetical protein
MIEADAIINEERFECDSEGGKAGGGSSDEEDEDAADEYLDALDMKVLRDRILQAIEIFSKWNPHMKKDILKQRKNNKLSIENRSRGNGANSSKKSKSDRSYSQQGDEKSAQGAISPRKSYVVSTGRRGTQNMSSLKQQQMDIIDSFLKEYGLINPSFNIGGRSTQQTGLSLIGSRIQKLSDLDDEVLSTISNEILRFNSSKKKKPEKEPA